TQSFMKASHPPIPFDPQGLVALNFLSTCQVWSDLRCCMAMLSVSPGVEVDAAHFLEADVDADGRRGRPVRLEDSGFHAHGAGIRQPSGHQRGIDPMAT